MPLTYKTVGSTYLVAAYSTLFPATGTLGSVTATTVTINNLSANYTYTINRYTGATATGTPVVLVTGYNVGSSGPTFLDNGATANTQYTYTVVGTNSYTATSPVNLGTIWTLANATLAATTATPTGETISWTNPAYASITITNNTNPSATVTYNSMTPLSWIDTLDTAGNTTYTYTVSVKNGGGISTTLSTNLSVSTISAITNVVATSTVAGQISVTWSGGLSPVAPTYTLSLLSGTGTTIGSTTISSGASTTTAGSATLTLSSTASIVTGITVSATNSYETVSGNTSTNVTTSYPANTVYYAGNSTLYNNSSLSTTTTASTLSSGNGIIYTPNLLSNGVNYNVFAFGMSNPTGSSANNYILSYNAATAKNVYVFAVGGGGAGGTYGGYVGGGGGGGVSSTIVSVSSGYGQITISVGAGGVGATYPNSTNGANTVVKFSVNSTQTITCYGGGTSTPPAGGASGAPTAFAGGANLSGGGGGAGGVGADGVSPAANYQNGGTGGPGALCSSTLYGVKDMVIAGNNISTWYWAGGGGGAGYNAAGNGGIGGGGGGGQSTDNVAPSGGSAINSVNGTNGIAGSGGANTGAGGGSNWTKGAGNGGSGIVIIAIPV